MLCYTVSIHVHIYYTYSYTIHTRILYYIALYLEMGSGAVFMTIVVPALYRGKTLWFPNFDPYNLRYSV